MQLRFNKLHAPVALTALAAWSLTATAQARPATRGDCVAFSEKDMQGQAFGVSQKQDPTATSQKLPFQAKSFFLADGYAVKVFEKPLFAGVGEFDGSALQVANGSVAATDGGHTFNVGHFYVQNAAGSFACVPAGQIWTDLADFPTVDQFLYLPGQKFVTDGHGYHAPYASASLDEKDGKKLLTFESGWYGSLNRRGTLDLDTGAIVLEQHDFGHQPSLVSRQVVKRDPSVAGIDLQYAAAARLIADSLKLLIANPAGYGPHSTSLTVPHLELQQIYDLVWSRTYGI